jgi:hypothetical protein
MWEVGGAWDVESITGHNVDLMSGRIKCRVKWALAPTLGPKPLSFPANSPPLTTYIARECNGVDPRMFYHSGAVVQAPLTANSLLPIMIKQAVVGWLGVRHAVVAAPKLGQGL